MKKIKEHEIIKVLYWGLGVVPKIDHEINVSISTGYIITFHLFSVLC